MGLHGWYGLPCAQLYLSLQTEPWHIPHNGSYRSWMHGRPGDIRIALGGWPAYAAGCTLLLSAHSA